MAVASHMGAVAVAELDLSASCGPNTIVDRINAMPALKTSAGESIFLFHVFWCSYRYVYSEPCSGNLECDVDDATSCGGPAIGIAGYYRHPSSHRRLVAAFHVILGRDLVFLNSFMSWKSALCHFLSTPFDVVKNSRGVMAWR